MDDGYMLFKNILSTEEINEGVNCIKENKVDYIRIQNFIENMLQKVNSKLNYQLKYVKYRVSDNNNSSDAGSLHRDIVCINNEIEFPLYTCLTYFDKTIMELIPKSSDKHKYDLIETIPLFFNSKKIIMEPGDILFFKSNILHRGIFSEKLEHRRLIQVFDIFENKESFDKYKKRILNVRGNEKNADMFIYLHKNYFSSYILNIFGFLNASTGHGFNYNNDFATKYLNLPYNNHSYISTEGLRSRIIVEPGTLQDINKYILNDTDIDDLPDELYDNYIYQCYNKQFMMYISFILLLIIIIILKGSKLI
jgi:hypothetical protein